MITLDFSGIDRITDRAICKLELLKCEIERELNPIPEMTAIDAEYEYLRGRNYRDMMNAWGLAIQGMRGMTEEERADMAARQYEGMRPSALTGRQGLI